MQSRRQSLLEACVGTAIGFIVALLTTALVFPLFGIDTPISTEVLITIIFTFVSVLRSYLIRRLFNWWHSQ